MAILRASASVTFADSVTRIVIETEPGAYVSAQLPVDIYPANPDIVRATVGTITQEANRDKSVIGEALKYQDAQNAQLEYPGASGLVTTDINALIDVNGNLLTGVTHAYNGAADAVFANYLGQPVNVTGAVRADYTARYSRYLYSPQITTSTRGQIRRFGTIVAIKNGVVATLSFQPGFGNRRNYTELYRVYSEIVLDPDGAWEKPPSFPDSNNYPGIGNAGPSTTTYVIDQRVHEYGYIYDDGFYVYDRVHIRFEVPYVGNANYQPALNFRQATAPEGYEDAFSRVKWDDIYADLEDRHNGLSI